MTASNIFDMYRRNGYRVGFWIQRESWGETVARVVSIAGQTEGHLHGAGTHPYYDLARDLVFAELYNITGIGPIRLTRILTPLYPAPGHPDLTVISCPGSFSYNEVHILPEYYQGNQPTPLSFSK